MNKKLILKNTINFVKETLKGAEGGHDWFHIERVWRNAKLIAQSEEVDDIYSLSRSSCIITRYS